MVVHLSKEQTEDQPKEQPIEQFSQIHIDVARNATDDFNLFHDEQRWQRIAKNPFQGPIVLGFQIESLIEHKIRHHRQKNNEENFLLENNLNFSNYQFSFANAIKPNQTITVDIKKTLITDNENSALSNRISVKADGKLCLIGFKKETQFPLFLNETNIKSIKENLTIYPDHSFLSIKQGAYFLKRKFLNVSNAKNFLCSSLVDQRLFFDELIDRYNFPEIFPCAYISCALLEKSLLKQLDFEKSPMVYSSHKISIDRHCLSQLKSNDVLHILIKKQENKTASNTTSYECYGLVAQNMILFRAIVELIPLASIIKKPALPKKNDNI